jgi:hypothetical protein
MTVQFTADRTSAHRAGVAQYLGFDLQQVK